MVFKRDICALRSERFWFNLGLRLHGAVSLFYASDAVCSLCTDHSLNRIQFHDHDEGV